MVKTAPPWPRLSLRCAQRPPLVSHAVVATCRHVCPLPAPCLPPDGVPTSCMSWVNLFPGCMLGLRGQALQAPSGTDSLWTPATVAITPWLAWTPLPSPIAEVTVVLSVRASASGVGAAGTSVAAADFPGSLHAAMLAAARQIQGTPEVCGFTSLARNSLFLPHLPLRLCRSVLSLTLLFPSNHRCRHTHCPVACTCDLGSCLHRTPSSPSLQCPVMQLPPSSGPCGPHSNRSPCRCLVPLAGCCTLSWATLQVVHLAWQTT